MTIQQEIADILALEKEILESKTQEGAFWGQHRLEARAFRMAAIIRALSDAVVILPDDAEPMVGDIVMMPPAPDIRDEPAIVDDYYGQPECRYEGCGYTRPKSGTRIIQRNGKPCIYESELNKLMEIGATHDQN